MIPITVLSFPSTPPFNPNPNSSSLFPRRRRRTAAASGDPNAESVRAGRFRFRDDLGGAASDGFRSRRKRRWWSDDQFDPFEEDDEYDDDDDPWDKFWIIKVFRSYGYLLPAIIISTLLATGPKAFLMALSLPLAQSALSLAIEKVWGNVSESARTKPEYKWSPSNRTSTDFRKRGNEESSGGGYKGKSGYQSWVSAEDGVGDKRTDSRSSSFGGWDDLDNQRGYERNKSPEAAWSTQPEPMKKGKLSKKGSGVIFKYHRSWTSPTAIVTSPAPSAWSRPPAGQIKVNVDAGFSLAGARYAVVFRDADARLLEAFSGNIVCTSAQYAKATAILQALRITMQRAYLFVLVESDALEVINFIKSDDSSWPWSLRDILKQITQLLDSSTSTGVKVQFVNRSANLAAHLLASHPVVGPQQHVFYTLPSLISAQLDNELFVP